MLVLRRREGQWVEITDRAGNILRVRLTNIRLRGSFAVADLVFDDSAKNFTIHRPERVIRPVTLTT